MLDFSSSPFARIPRQAAFLQSSKWLSTAVQVLTLVSCLLFVCSMPSGAEDLRAPFIFGPDDRKIADSRKSPWSAIGKVQYTVGTGAYVFCTGTLVAPSVVVTVAGCLERPDGHFVPAPHVHFLAGLKGDKWAAHSVAACIVPLTEPSGDDDIAILVLRNALPVGPVPLAENGSLANGPTVTHAGYAEARPYVLSVDMSCHVRELTGGVALTDCDSDPGQSGGPVLIDINGRKYIAGVMVSHQKAANIAVPVERWRKLAIGDPCPRS